MPERPKHVRRPSRLRSTKRKIFVDACCGTRIDDVSLDPDNAELPGDLEAIKEPHDDITCPASGGGGTARRPVAV